MDRFIANHALVNPAWVFNKNRLYAGINYINFLSKQLEMKKPNLYAQVGDLISLSKVVTTNNRPLIADGCIGNKPDTIQFAYYLVSLGNKLLFCFMLFIFDYR